MESSIYWPTFFFYLFAAIACLFAVAMLLSSHVVHMAFYLVLSLAATAGLFILAGADFVGAMQIMIYVGGTLVLLVFGVMLTSSAPFVSMKTRSGEWIVAAVVGGSLLAMLVWAAFLVPSWRHADLDARDRPVATPTATRIGMRLIDLVVETSPEEKQVDESADGPLPRSTGYLLAFEVISVHLLVVLVGAAYLARTRRRVSSDV
jgi:NADH-quinone oxidoreductase subunit J